MVQWGDLFWGEGNRSFEILSNNVKNGAIAIEELQRFLNESAQCESTYCKNLSRLQSQLIKTQHVGTFTPIWNLIRELLDKISSTHVTTLNFYQDLLRDIHNYQDLYHKKFKSHIQKDNDIIRIPDLISQLHSSLNTVHKAKEQYQLISLDYERGKRLGSSSTNSSSLPTSSDGNPTNLAQMALNSFSSRQNERLEKKYRQAQDDYKSTIEKYNLIRNDYEKRFYDACTKFQDFEIDHIEKMLALSLNYSDMLQRNNEQIRSTQNEFNDKLKSLTGRDLLDLFVEQRKTGTDRPAILQFEEVDHQKNSMQLINSNINDSSINQDDVNSLDQSESNVPSFQAHFTVSTANTKSTDHHRALSPNSSSNYSNSSNNNPTMSTSINIPPTTITSTMSNPITRSQEINNSNNDQTSNPFDLKIKRPKFPVFFGSNRKTKIEKKIQKKLPTNILTSKPSQPQQQQQQQRDELNETNLQNSNIESNIINTNTDNHDDYVNISPVNNKHKCATPEPYIQSNNDINHDINQSIKPLPLSKISQSSSSSDTSDDDDDNPMLKINFKINPISPTLADEDDETKIINAVRLVDKNIGNFLSNSRGSSRTTPDINKSISSGQIGTNILPIRPPPPIPSRSVTTIPNIIATDNIDQSSMFPSNDAFDQSFSHTNTMNITLTNEEDVFAPLQSTRESKNTTSISSIDDDAEVANSFPNDNLINKTTPFPILQVPPLHQSNQYQSTSASVSPSFNNSIVSNENEISSLNIDTIEQIPLAIAFQETIHVMMSGDNHENWKCRIIGEMLISFPASILNLFIDSSHVLNQLEFRLKNLDNIENITINSSLITQNESIYSFDMNELNNILHKLQDRNPSARFFNLNILNYEIKHSDISNIPIEISSQWTRTFDNISVNINYRFNNSSLPQSIRFNNDSIIIYTIITDGQQIKESSPTAEWSTSEQKLWWKVPYINNGTGSLSAIVMTAEKDINENDSDQQALTTSSIINAYFIGENGLFSSIDFDLTCQSYRISLLKKKILSGKYQSEPDQREPIHLFQRPNISLSSTT